MERDYVKYPNLGRPPQTLHEQFRVDPLGCATYPEYARLHEHFRADPRGADSFKKWIEDRIWELLQKPGQIEYYGDERTWEPMFGTVNHATLAQCIDTMSSQCAEPENVRGFLRARVVLLDGTVIKEWPSEHDAPLHE